MVIKSTRPSYLWIRPGARLAGPSPTASRTPSTCGRDSSSRGSTCRNRGSAGLLRSMSAAKPRGTSSGNNSAERFAPSSNESGSSRNASNSSGVRIASRRARRQFSASGVSGANSREGVRPVGTKRSTCERATVGLSGRSRGSLDSNEAGSFWRVLPPDGRPRSRGGLAIAFCPSQICDAVGVYATEHRRDVQLKRDPMALSFPGLHVI